MLECARVVSPLTSNPPLWGSVQYGANPNTSWGLSGAALANEGGAGSGGAVAAGTWAEARAPPGRNWAILPIEEVLKPFECGTVNEGSLWGAPEAVGPIHTRPPTAAVASPTPSSPATAGRTRLLPSA